MAPNIQLRTYNLGVINRDQALLLVNRASTSFSPDLLLRAWLNSYPKQIRVTTFHKNRQASCSMGTGRTVISVVRQWQPPPAESVLLLSFWKSGLKRFVLVTSGHSTGLKTWRLSSRLQSVPLCSSRTSKRPMFPWPHSAGPQWFGIDWFQHMLSKNQEEASKKDSTEESQQDIAANEKGIHNLETEEIKRESPPLQHPACAPEIWWLWPWFLGTF